MSLAMSETLNTFCEQHNLYEYGMYHIVTMPNGYTFVTESVELANRMLREHGAQTRHIVELGE